MSQPPIDSNPTIGELGYEVVDHLRHDVAMQVRNLLSPQSGESSERFIIDDQENIEQAIRCGIKLDALLFSGDQALPFPLAETLKPTNTPVYEVARRTCKKIFDKERASRLFAIAHKPSPRPLYSLAQSTRDIVVLDHLTIQGNIGAIIRNAVAFEMGAVVLLGADQNSIYDRRLVRSSRGYVFSLPIIGASTLEFVEFAKDHELPIAITDAHGQHQVETLSLEMQASRIAMVMGSEKHGCGPEIRNAAQLSVAIPMNLDVESLNVSAACAIMMHRRYAFNGQKK